MQLLLCDECEKFEKEQNQVRKEGREAFLAGEQARFNALDAEECRIIGRLKEHQALDHDHSQVYEGQLWQE